MKIAAKQLKKLIREMAQFAATAEEEAKKVNSDAGISLVTDQAFWEERGISTGEELAKSLLSSTYSDYYKELHGFRPRWMEFSKMSIEEVQAALDALDAEAAEMAAEDEHWKKIEKEQEDWDAVMTAAVRSHPEDIPEEYLEYEAPTQQGMGRRPAGSKSQRRMESKMKITKRQLRRLIREEKRKVLREGITQEENLFIALQDYVIALSDQMPGNSIVDFKPDALAFVEGWFENQALAEENDEDPYGGGTHAWGVE